MYLIVKKILFIDDPEAGQLFQAVQRLEGGQVVDEYVGHPQVAHKVEIDWKPRYLGGVGLCHRENEPLFLPMDAKVHVKAHGELFVVHSEDIEHLSI